MSNKAAKRGLVPKLRFPAFREAGEWDEKQVGEVFKVTRGEVLSMTLVQDEKTNEARYPVYSSQTKNNGLSGYYSDFLYEDAITWTTDGANAGDVNYRSGKFYCTNVCGVLINTDGYANPCIAALINSVSRSHVSYVGNPKLMNGVMSKIVVPFPSVKEQQKIADCLASLDERITLEAQKLDTLKTHKKGLMQQLFPAEGETLPKLRFPEFRNADGWIIKRLCEVADVNASGDLDPENFSPTKTEDHIYPIYSNSVTQEGLYGYCTYPKFEKNSVTITARGTLGVAFYRDHEYVGIGRLLVLSNLNNIVPRYLREVWNYSAKMPLENGGIPQLTAIKARAVELWMPGKEEQQKIADCLASLDDRITAQTQKLTALKTHKKGLMQQLFPAMG